MDAHRASPRIVAAVSREVRRRVRAILPDCDLRFVANCEELLRETASARCDMLLLGMHFDESTAVAALERVRSRERTLTVVCVRARPSLVGQRSLNALRAALHEFGANFIDLMDYPDDAAGNARVRAMLERLLYPCGTVFSI